MSPTADATRPPEFVLSLDFELLWGVRDHADRVTYGRNILGAREAIPRMLELFARHRIAATWATVGFLFCRDRDELIAALPPEELRPRYANPLLSSYGYLDELGRNEREDPYVFGASLLDRIQETPLQEIGTHTLSHFYCLEDGQSEAMFEADLTAAAMLAGRRGLLLRSIVFPRNQYAAGHLAVCRRHGICAYRGNPAHWAYAPTAGETLRRRALRFIDQHTGVLGPWMTARSSDLPANVTASRFLRPLAGPLRGLHPAHRATIRSEMRKAAETGAGYHLWWHPHNFGGDLEGSLACLAQLLDHFEMLRDSYGMVSRSMDGTMHA